MKNTKEKNISQVVRIVLAVPEVDGSVVVLGSVVGSAVLGGSMGFSVTLVALVVSDGSVVLKSISKIICTRLRNM